CGDLFVALRSPALHPFHDLHVYDIEGEALDYVKAHQGFYRTYLAFAMPGNPPVMPKQGTLREIYSITDYEILSVNRYTDFYNLLEARPPDKQLLPPASIGYLNLDPVPLRLRLLDLLSVRYIVAARIDVPFISKLTAAGSSWRLAHGPRS